MKITGSNPVSGTETTIYKFLATDVFSFILKRHIQDNKAVNNSKNGKAQEKQENRIGKYVHNLNLLVKNQLDPQKNTVNTNDNNNTGSLLLSIGRRVTKSDPNVTCPAAIPNLTEHLQLSNGKRTSFLVCHTKIIAKTADYAPANFWIDSRELIEEALTPLSL